MEETLITPPELLEELEEPEDCWEPEESDEPDDEEDSAVLVGVDAPEDLEETEEPEEADEPEELDESWVPDGISEECVVDIPASDAVELSVADKELVLHLLPPDRLCKGSNLLAAAEDRS